MKRDEIVKAGGIAVGKTNAALSGVDTVTARTYRQAALGDRVVVRLVPAALGEAEDLAADFLGFGSAARPAGVGTGQLRALGFPAWALVHDRRNGRHALAMVKDMQRLARLAKVKPGNAEDGYRELASRLDTAAPHFLPTFWEEAGRAFLAADNPKQAATAFGRGRAAEHNHALPVDEERLAQVHLEFALAGGLNAKSLSQYGRELAGRVPPAEAYQRFREVARQRIAGGLPPHVGLADDLRRLARAAGRTAEAEAASFLADVLDLPAVAKAAMTFWRSFTKALTALLAGDPRARAALLLIVPDPPGRNTDVTGDWIRLLGEVGATVDLIDRAPAAVARVSATGWLDRIVAHRLSRSWMRAPRSEALLSLATAMAPRLRNEDQPIRVTSADLRTIDLDLADLCLTENIPLAIPPATTVDVGAWVNDSAPGRRTLRALARHPVLGPKLRAALVPSLHARAGRYADGAAALPTTTVDWYAGVHGLAIALADWCEELAAGSVGASAATLAAFVDRLGPLWSAAGVAVAPDAIRRLAAADVAEGLALTLRTGIMAEYGWSAYDEAVAGFAGPPRCNIAWPYLVLLDERRAVVLGPGGRLLDHVFVLPPAVRGHRPDAIFVDGQLLVTWSDGYNQPRRAYWSDRPDHIFVNDARHYFGSSEHNLPARHVAPQLVHLDGGGATTGQRPWHAGDTTVPSSMPVATDGVSYWRCELVQHWPRSDWRWREFDPRKGTGGRYSVPAFFDKPAADPRLCALYPVPPEFAESPTGRAGCLGGLRVSREPGGGVRGERVDGRSVWLPDPDGPAGRVPDRQPFEEDLVAAIVMPASTTVHAVTARRGTWAIWTADGRQPASHPEQLPPVPFWAAMTPRDEAGSCTLRSLSVRQTRLLLTAVRGRAVADRPDLALAAVARLLPGIADATLRAGVAAEVVSAARTADRLAELASLTGSAPAAEPENTIAVPINRDVLARAMAAIRSPRHGVHFRAFTVNAAPDRSVTEQMMAAAAAFSGIAQPAGRHHLALDDLDWGDALTWPKAVLARAASFATDPAERGALLLALETLAAAGLLRTDGTLRIVTAEQTVGAEGLDSAEGHVIRTGGERVAIVLKTRFGRDGTGAARTAFQRLLEQDGTGRFGPVEVYSIVADVRPDPWAVADALAACARLRSGGPLPWRPELVARLVELSAMSRAEATLVLAGLPDIMSNVANFLEPAIRTKLGLSAREARTARDTLQSLPTPTLTRLLSAAVPAQLNLMWTEGPDLAAIAAVWRAEVTSTVTIDDEVLAEAGRLVDGAQAAAILRHLAEPHRAAWLANDEQLSSLVILMAWLAYRLPAHDPLRAALPVAQQLIRSRLSDPTYRIRVHLYGPDPALPALHCVNPGGFEYDLRPHLLTGSDDPALAHADRGDVAFLLSDGWRAVMTTCEKPDPTVRSLHDPAASTPEEVTDVARRHDLTRHAAAYYLQLLALPDPTDRNVMRWNGWTTTEFGAARSELTRTDFVLEAKRERAGRTLFVPGGWLPARPPNLPIEAWKAERLGLAPHPTLRVVMLDRPVPDLFRTAWQLVADGEGPRYATLGDRP